MKNLKSLRAVCCALAAWAVLVPAAAGAAGVPDPDEVPAMLAPPATQATEALLSKGRVRVGVTWKNPYTGEGGTATVAPQGDEFAYFTFSSAANPEVFVKALGTNSPEYIQLFAAGLTSFEYTVTFAGCGLTKTFKKPAFAKITYEDGAGFPSAGCLPVQPLTQRTLGGREKDYFPRAHGSGAVAQTPDGGFILTGTVGSNDGDISGQHGMYDIWVAKLSASLVLEWQRCLGGSKIDVAGGIVPTSDGGYALVGTTSSTDGDVGKGHGSADAWVVKLDAVGKIVWQKCYGGTGYDTGIAIVEVADGGFVFAGATNSRDGDVSGNHGGIDIWVVKIDKSGVLAWQKCIGGTLADYPNSLQKTSDGGFVVAGLTESNDGDVKGNHGNGDMLVAKLSGAGAVEWLRAVGGSKNDEGMSARQTSDGKYIVAGWTNSTDGDITNPKGGKDALLVLLDAAGKVVWARNYGGSKTDYAFSVVEAGGGSFAFAGETFSSDGDVSLFKGASDAWVVKVSATGAVTSSLCLGGSDRELAGSIIALAKGAGYLVAGWTGSSDGDVKGHHGGSDIWLVKLDALQLK